MAGRINILNLFVLLFTFFCFQPAVLAKVVEHDKNVPKFSVKWCASLSGESDLKTSQTFTSKIVNLIFGSAEKKLIKPVAVVSCDSNILRIMDQGWQSTLKVNQTEASFKSGPSFPSLIDGCIDKNSNFLFTDSKLNQVFIQTKINDKPKKLNESLELNRPTGIAYMKSDGTIWVVETAAHKISVLDEKGRKIKTFGGRGTTEGLFNYPTSIWIDNNNQVYVLDAMNFRVQIFDAEGKFLSAFGKPGDSSGYFGFPKSIATDSHGHIYVSDAMFHTVQIFDRNGNFLDYFGYKGRAAGEFWMPSGIYIDANDKIYVADTYNARIQMFQLIENDND